MRADEALSASVGMKPEYGTKGILNAETCSSICAALGCALGIMGGNSKDTSDAGVLTLASRCAAVFGTRHGLQKERLTVG